MKVILNEDVYNLGEEGDVVVVKRGYARNYLLPRGLAVAHNRANIALFASRAAAIEKRKEEKRKASSSMKEQLEELTLTMVMSAGESGKLFGSVTSAMVQDELSKLGFTVERKKIEVHSHMIKMVGTYPVRIRLYEEEVAELTIVVESEAVVKARLAEEAAAEAAAAEAAAKEAAKAAEEAAGAEAAAAQAAAEKAAAEAAEAAAAAEEAAAEAEVAEELAVEVAPEAVVAAEEGAEAEEAAEATTEE